ncbi:PfkB family carbohydrate kinase [Oscillatoria laete-virens NRMC-F 0139]|nr:PfkB family carbohydrate kinase [Oscillatoria laete-virens]MDL5054562.1 PfkB family carbohydrate kinase [Oscillatoria laete-virens NRMC-F 0139]
MTTTLRSWIDKLAGQRIVVIGDVILDEYLIGVATRMSREAPIPVLEFTSRQLIPGGAANPAANITALGSSAVQIAVIGADSSADALRAAMEARAIDTRAMIADPERPTTQKTRVLAQMGLRFPQQVAPAGYPFTRPAQRNDDSRPAGTDTARPDRRTRDPVQRLSVGTAHTGADPPSGAAQAGILPGRTAHRRRAGEF